jgi:pimeloyl-ACP methyl ester carboxylesterase
VVLAPPGLGAEEAIASLAREADRNGYILIAPDWAGEFANGWKWKGDDHVYVTAVLRDAVAHFCVDNDRVFLFGTGDGANVAMDVGMSHPDLFAGVLAMGPVPKWFNLFNNYWANAQKLPFYCVTGELSGDSAANLRLIFNEWMPKGFPGMMVVYKGRGIEWYGSEVPTMFDWMGRKKRVSATATFAPGPGVRPAFATMRPTDNRFYWLGVDDMVKGRMIDDARPRHQVLPATIWGDITSVSGANLIALKILGTTRVSLYLTHDLIDWTKPVRVTVNGAAPNGYKAKVLEPDLQQMLEDYRERGDRRAPILGRIEINTVP